MNTPEGSLLGEMQKTKTGVRALWNMLFRYRQQKKNNNKIYLQVICEATIVICVINETKNKISLQYVTTFVVSYECRSI